MHNETFVYIIITLPRHSLNSFGSSLPLVISGNELICVIESVEGCGGEEVGAAAEIAAARAGVAACCAAVCGS